MFCLLFVSDYTELVHTTTMGTTSIPSIYETANVNNGKYVNTYYLIRTETMYIVDKLFHKKKTNAIIQNTCIT